ncbi:MAG: transcription-repair coupling factor, partial [Rhodobacteraceae bacterium]|nr:transcription-repair coupling factor [Paracoccaceae bacterium]
SVLVDDLNSLSAGSGMLGLSVWRLEHGFRFRSLTVLSEQDIFGARLARPPRRKRKLPRFLTEGGQLSQGDLVVHVEHGIGRFVGLKTIEVGVFRHECIALEYAGGDIMYIPVENSEVLSRLGPEKHALDRLGSVNWQRRKARLKKRLLALARELVETAAKRQLQQAPAMARDSKSWDLLLSSFQYLDTEDQQQAVADVVADLECGRPMDRLICGDVGFGKTEVAVRAAFISAMAGWQVAILAPTTLLVRQHYARFSERLEEFPLEVRHLSRMTGTREAAATKAGLANGKVDIVIGTHTLLGRRIKFDRLGLLIVDEEQSFGVVQKERLKQLKSDLHVLALTATPIPRTLQLATTGVRDMSIISTPPIDRLAIRTYVLEFDPVAIRQALLREHYRGGQSFVVVPRIRDIAGLAKFLQEQVPEVSFRSAHGRMHSEKLANCMNGFYEGKFGVLLSTTIIASGLDIEAANTIVVCNADRFGLAQLYQIRGRVGRSDVRAYAYVTYSPKRPLNEQARRRLKAFSGLECLGAGFSVASQDLDIRGAGNLLGDEQSGHIREVGLELYQSMLEEAIAKLRAESGSERQVAAESSWTPQLRLGVDAKIPEEYVPDPDVRLGLYRRLATLTTDDELTEMKEELADRFGPVPSSLHTFFELLQIKSRCKEAGIASLSCGPKGAVVTFHDSSSADVDRLARFARLQRGQVRVNRDRIFFKRTWPSPRHHLSGARKIVGDLMEFKRRHAAGQYAVSSSMEWR